MKNWPGVFAASVILTVTVSTAAAPQGTPNGNDNFAAQTFALGQKIMGYDVAPLTGQDGRKGNIRSRVQYTAGPSETGLGVYRGMVFANFEKPKIICDFGSLGVWCCYGLRLDYWSQLSGADPDTIIAGRFKSMFYDQIVGDFGSLGLWMWDYTPSPGSWTQLSGADALWEFAADDDNDFRQELFANFGTLGVWRYDGADGWKPVSGLNPSHGLRINSAYPSSEEEAGFCFDGAGVWRISSVGSNLVYDVLTGTSTNEDDHGSGMFVPASSGEDLVMDFAGLGLWLLSGNSNSEWHLISLDDVDRLAVVRFSPGNKGLVIVDNYKTGLWYWRYVDSFPGVESQIHTMTPDCPLGFVEPFEYSGYDDIDELAADFGAAGLWVYVSYVNMWIQIDTRNPVCMVAGDWLGNGIKNHLLVNFGPTAGLWLYSGVINTWYQISQHSPDYSTS